jgi:hypothetical protein
MLTVIGLQFYIENWGFIKWWCADTWNRFYLIKESFTEFCLIPNFAVWVVISEFVRQKKISISHIDRMLDILRVRDTSRAIGPWLLTSKLPIKSLVTSREVSGGRRGRFVSTFILFSRAVIILPLFHIYPLQLPERVCWTSSNATDSYSEGTRFEYRSGCTLLWMKLYSFPLLPPGKFWDKTRMGNDRLAPNFSNLTIILPSGAVYSR